MRNLAVLVACVTFIALGVTQCGSDDKPTKTGDGGSTKADTGGGGTKLGGCYGTTGQTCTGTAAYESCLITKCDAKMKACYGSDYQNGNFGGACAALIQCSVACKCDATYQSCVTACASKMTAECTTCATEMGTCITAAGCTQPVCTGGTGTGDCTTLATCCATIQQAMKASCDAVVTAANGAACSQTYTSWKTAGYCQ